MASNLHLRLNQISGQETNVPAQLVTKLYNIYKGVQNGTINWDCDENSIKGTMKTGYTYDKYVDALTTFFNNFTINVDGYYIYFEDPIVESILFTQLIQPNYSDKNYEGVIAGIQVNNSGNAKQQGFQQIFRDNREIQTFDELPKLINVKSLAYEEFRDCQSLSSVDLTNIETLNEGAFRSCVSLEYFNGRNSTKGDLRLPNLKPSGLGQYVFYWFQDGSIYKGPQIKRILDLGDCTTTGMGSFYRCKTLEYVDDSVLEKFIQIGHNLFFECENLVINDLKLPNTTNIGENAFQKVKIKKISQLGTSCKIANSAFANITQLTEISDEALSEISELSSTAFQGCTNLIIEDLSMPKLEKIGQNAFASTKIKYISNLGTITTIQGFSNCTQLLSVNIPLTTNTVGYQAFKNCDKINILPFIERDNLLYSNECFAGIKTLPQIIMIKNTKMEYTPFLDTNVRSLYLPKLINTNGISGTSCPGVGRRTANFRCGSNMDIFYLKDIRKIHGCTFGGWTYISAYGTACTRYRDSSGNLTERMDATHYTSVYSDKKYAHPYRNIIDGTVVWEYLPNGPIPYYGKNEKIVTNGGTYSTWDPYNHQSFWANIKYLVINNITPPTYWQTVMGWGDSCLASSLGLYQQSSNGQNETFKYLVVPRSAINDYLNWDAFPKPDPNYPSSKTGRFDDDHLESADRTEFYRVTKFDNDDPNNPRIIALESMGHFATKAEYDAAPDMPDGVHGKGEYLIEEYMGLGIGETINWDPTPTWSV